MLACIDEHSHVLRYLRSLQYVEKSKLSENVFLIFTNSYRELISFEKLFFFYMKDAFSNGLQRVL